MKWYEYMKKNDMQSTPTQVKVRRRQRRTELTLIQDPLGDTKIKKVTERKVEEKP